MLIASLNFARHIVALRRLSLEPYRQDPECKAIFAILSVSVVGIAVLLTSHGVYPDFMVALRHAAFNVVSQATTSGLTSQDYQQWPVFAPYWMLFLSCIVCSTGSTGGGIKMFRTLLLARQAGREMKLLIHPAAMAPVRIGGRPIPDGVGRSVLAFIFLYFMTVALLTFAMLLTGMDFDSAFSAVVASINNTAHGFGAAGCGPQLPRADAAADLDLHRGDAARKAGDLQRHRAVPARVLAQVRARLTARGRRAEARAGALAGAARRCAPARCAC